VAAVVARGLLGLEALWPVAVSVQRLRHQRRRDLIIFLFSGSQIEDAP
jgi:hypothetical protein